VREREREREADRQTGRQNVYVGAYMHRSKKKNPENHSSGTVHFCLLFSVSLFLFWFFIKIRPLTGQVGRLAGQKVPEIFLSLHPQCWDCKCLLFYIVLVYVALRIMKVEDF